MIKLIILAVIIGVAVFLYLSNKWITITEYHYRNRKVPKTFDGYKILQVSDLQSGYFGKNQSSLIKKTKSTNPDVIFFTGDLVDRNKTDLQASMSAMKQLVEVAPVFYVSGNHELAIEEKLNHFYDELKSAGVQFLFDQTAEIQVDDEKINLMGISDETLCRCKLGVRRRDTAINPEPLKSMIEELTEQISVEHLNLLLSHEPQFFEYYVHEKVDLVFTGHAHGGQIRLPFTDGLFAPGQGILPKYTSGIRKKENTTMVINRGLGNSVFPFRIFNRPELVLVTIENVNEL